MKREYQIILTGILTGLTAVCMGAEIMPSVSSLLDQYTQALDSTSSFIHDFECTTKASYKLQQGDSFQGTKYSRGQVRNKGQCLYTREYTWGDFNNKLTDLPENEPYYDCSVVNDEMFYQNTRHINYPNDNGSAARVPRREGVETSLSRNFGVGAMLGYIGSDKRLDEILRSANTISVREKSVTMQGVKCYVIEADTEQGQYTVWLDSEHGYHPAQVFQKTKTGDVYYGFQLTKGDSAKSYVQNVQFEQVDGIWVPVEIETGNNFVLANGTYSKDDYHYKLTDVILNPDHDALGSFADPINENPANDPELKDGTQVRLNHLPTTYIWKDGKLIPNIDKEAVHQIDTLTESILMKDKLQDEDESVILAVILAAYKKTQDSLNTFYCESKTTGEGFETQQTQYAADGTQFSFKILTDDKAIETGCVYNGTCTLVKRGEAISACTDPNKPYILLSADYPGAPLLGYLNSRTERIDSILQKAIATATVSSDPIDAKKCFRVTATIGKDTYKVWFAPFYGYQILKAEIVSDNQAVYSLDELKFKDVENRWIPVACQVKRADSPAYTYRRNRVELEPDFKMLKAFELPVSDGMAVQVEGKPGKFFWKNGQITDEEGNHAF